MYNRTFSLILLIFGINSCKTGLELKPIEDILKFYQSVGFFSKCSGYANQTAFNTLAEHVETEVNRSLVHHKNFNFVTYDVCDDTGYLIKSIVDLLLDRRYFFSERTSNQNATLRSRDQNVILIVAYVSKEMSKMIKDLVGGLHPTIARLCEPFECDERFPSIQMEDYVDQISNFFNRFKLYDVTFINIATTGEEPSLGDTYYNEVFNSIRDTNKFCLSRKTFSVMPYAYESDRYSTHLSVQRDYRYN